MDIEINLSQISMQEFENFTLIDVREEYEREIQPIDSNPSLHFPLSEFDGDTKTLEKEKKYLVVCAHGMRSAGFTEYLRENGFSQTYSIPQGIETLYQYINEHSSKSL